MKEIADSMREHGIAWIAVCRECGHIWFPPPNDDVCTRHGRQVTRKIWSFEMIDALAETLYRLRQAVGEDLTLNELLASMTVSGENVLCFCSECPPGPGAFRAGGCPEHWPIGHNTIFRNSLERIVEADEEWCKRVKEAITRTFPK